MIKNIVRSFFAVFLMQLLVACGSGGSSCDFNDSCAVGGVVPGDEAVPAVAISLRLISSLDGLETNNISISDPGRLVATVTGASESVIVTFSASLGTVSNSGAVLSDNAGVATVDLLPGAILGAGTASASVTVGEETYTDDVVFEIKAANAVGTNLQFVSAIPETITLKGAGGSEGSSETSVVEFKVLDADGSPVSGQEVSFSLNTSSGGVSLNPIVATSGASGLVRTIVTSKP